MKKGTAISGKLLHPRDHPLGSDDVRRNAVDQQVEERRDAERDGNGRTDNQ